MNDAHRDMDAQASTNGPPCKRLKGMPSNDSDRPVGCYLWDSKNVFHGIQTGNIPAEKLFDRPHTFALLDHRPATHGHCLVVTKHPVATLLQPLPLHALGDTLQDVQTLARAVHEATGCIGIHVKQNNGPAANQTVPQLHFHLVPRYSKEESIASESERSLIQLGVAELLIEKIRNTLPIEYSGEGCHAWLPTAEAMERLGMALYQLCTPGTAVLLNGQLGSGKTCIARGLVRAFCRDPDMFVPSPTFLLNLSYQQDTSHEKLPSISSNTTPSDATTNNQPNINSTCRTVHHMDPYRLGTKTDKMAGLIDFSSAFENDICVIEWPSRMPAEVMKLPRKQTIEVSISGTGAQAAGRHVHIQCLSEDGPAKGLLTTWRRQGLPELQVSWKASNGGPDRSLLFDPSALLKGAAEEWLVLGIESSCDDTAAAVVRGDGTVLAHKVASQTGLHEQYGGVKPDVARDAHAAAITSTVDCCLEEAGVTPDQLTAVAVTVGPGLSICLQVGVRHALCIAAAHRKPIVPVHHMEAHALITRMPGISDVTMEFPALLLLVSGGHNMLVKCEGIGRHRILGTTIDDSVGEAFDKTARLLGISSIPGGPHLESLAATASPQDIAAYKGRITMPLRNDRESSNFSFSGLKTSVATLVASEKQRLKGDTEALERAKAGIACTFQDVCVRFLKERADRALGSCLEDSRQLGEPMVTCLVVAGGVAANRAVRAALQSSAEAYGVPLVCPPIKYCMDNGLMVAWTGIERLKLGLYHSPPLPQHVDGSVEVLPRWPIGPVDVRGMKKRTEKHLKLKH